MTKGDGSGEINDLIDFLKKAKAKGATHYKMRWSNDPHFAFKWFETYKELSPQEIKQEKINALKQKIKEIKNH